MSTINTIRHDQFSDQLGLADQLESDVGQPAPSPWGIARLIRREVRRRGLVTRRELRRMIEPFLVAAGFDLDAATVIRCVADRMVDVGEIADLRVENQRGYTALPSRWICLSESDAVLLGTTATETHRFSSFHPRQFLRRFRPSERIVRDLERIGIRQEPFGDWLGEPAWKELLDTNDRIETLQDLLQWHVARLKNEGAPFSPADTMILAIEHRPGEFFGQPWNPKNTRWKAPQRLKDGIYLGAQPGYHERQWHPLLLELDGKTGRSFPLNCRNDPQAVNELRNWLLVALGAQKGLPERVNCDHAASEITVTFQSPSTLRRCLNLAGEVCQGWTYTVLDSKSLQKLLGQSFPEIEFIAQ